MNISPVILTLIALAAVVILVVTALSKKKIVASSFTKKPLMNKAEIRHFRMLQEELPSNWTVLCQVAYGGFLANRNFGKFMSMNSKRADFVILNPLLEVTVVVEYQGSGHYGNTEKSRSRAEASDQAKRQALSQAAIPLFEIPAKFDREFVRSFANAVIGPAADRAEAKARP